MSDWSSFEKDKAYTDQWRTFLTEKKLPKEQEEAINEGFMDLFKSAEAKDTNAAEVLDDFQQAFVDIFNKIKKRLHPDLLDDINNLEMPSDKEVAATKAPPPAADAPAADAAEDKEEPEARVAAESIDRTEEFISLLKEVDTFLAAKEARGRLAGFMNDFVAPFVELYIKHHGKDIKSFEDAYKQYITNLEQKEAAFKQLAVLLPTVLGKVASNDVEGKNEYIQDLFFQALNSKVKELPDAQPQAAETTPAEEPKQEPQAEQPNQEPQPEKEAAQDKQLTSFSHFFDLYYSTRFGSIPSSGNVKLRSKVIRQLADLLKKGKANDTVIGMFTYLNRIYKQRERRAGAPASEPTPDQPTAASEPTDAAAPDSETVPDNVIYLDSTPPSGKLQRKSFSTELTDAGVRRADRKRIRAAFKQDFENAKFVVNEGRRRISLTNTIKVINSLDNEEVKEKVKKIFVDILKRYKLAADNKDDQKALRSKASSAAASPPPEAESPGAEASASEPDASESDGEQSDDEDKKLPDNVIDLDKIITLRKAFGNNQPKIDDDKLRKGIPKVLDILLKKTKEFSEGKGGRSRRRRARRQQRQNPSEFKYDKTNDYVASIKDLILATTSLSDTMSDGRPAPIQQMAISSLGKVEQAELKRDELRPIVAFLGRIGGTLKDPPEELRPGKPMRTQILDAFKDIITPFVGQEYVTESIIYDRMKVLAGIK